MDRLTQLRGEVGGSGDSTLDSSALPSEAYITANEASSSKFFSLTEDDSTFDISPIKDVSLASAANPDKSLADTDELMSDLSPIPKKSDLLDSYKIGKQIDPANILSGGVDIFDDNDNSYDGDELVIDDNVVEVDEKSNNELKLTEPGLPFQKSEEITETLEHEPIASKDTEVVLQIDGKNVNAIDLGNGLYLYRKEGEEELAAVQIVDDDHQQPSFKFLKVRENTERNLEVYEEIEVEVPKEVPAKEGKHVVQNASHVPIKDISKVINDPICNKVAERKNKALPIEESSASAAIEPTVEVSKDTQESKPEANLNGKMMKINEMRKSPFIHSTPNKEGIRLTKTMVDLHLHPNRHSDNVKTIEVHTDTNKQRIADSKQSKSKDSTDLEKLFDNISTEKELRESNDKLEVSFEDTCQTTVESEPDKEVIEEKCKKIGDAVENKVGKENSKEKHKSNTVLELGKDSKHLKVKEAAKVGEKPEALTQDLDETKLIANVNTEEAKNKNKIESKIEEVIDNKIVKAKLDMFTKDAKVDSLGTVAEIHTDRSEYEKNVNKINDEQHTETVISTEHENKVKCDNDAPITIANVSNIEEKKPEKNLIEAKNVSDTDVVKCVENVEPPPLQSINDEKQITIQSIVKKNKEESKVCSSKIIHDALPVADIAKNELNLVEKQKNTANIYPLTEIDTPEKAKTLDNISIVSTVNDIYKKIDTNKKEQMTGNEKSLPIGNVNKQEEKSDNFAILNIKTGTVSKQNSSKETAKHDKSVTSKIDKIKPIVIKSDKLIDYSINLTQGKTELKREVTKVDSNTDHDDYPIVPFGQWTEANRQDFLNKIKETKVPTVSTNTKQLKQPNDLNRRDVLQKIDSQRQSNNAMKAYEVNTSHKLNIKNEAKSFVGKTAITQDKSVSREVKAPIKIEAVPLKNIPILNKKITKQELTQKPPKDLPNTIFSHSTVTKTDLPGTTFTISSVSKSDITKITYTPPTATRKDTTSTVTRKDLPNTTFGTTGMTKLDIANAIFSSSGVIKRDLPNTVFSTGSITKKDLPNTTFSTSTTKTDLTNATFMYTVAKKETLQRKEINNQDLIDKTIEGIINRALPTKEDIKQSAPKDVKSQEVSSSQISQSKEKKPPSTLDAIEMKMNELHGIPFVERPPHELPKVVIVPDIKTYAKQDSTKAANKTTKIPNLLPYSNKGQQKVTKENNDDSDEEVIEHEPITGDIEINKKNVSLPVQLPRSENILQSNTESSKKGTIITENDFDKFARRNSITYENCLTLNYEGTQPHNVLQAIIEKDIPVKKYSRNEMLLAEAKNKSVQKQSILLQNKAAAKLMSANDDQFNKNQSKFQIAYQSALTAKRQMESPITIIEDKPVKVVFMDSHTHAEYTPIQLNVQGKELSPAKKPVTDDVLNINTSDSVDSDMLDVIGEGKTSDETKSKTKHQRKQVLTPVETPELELIEPKDLGIDVSSPKKKRKFEDTKSDRSPKALVPKKSYLLGRSTVSEDKLVGTHDLTKDLFKETINQGKAIVSHNDAASAIDNLVKAAELLETQTQSETLNPININKSILNDTVNSDTQQNTPVKRGRGRPRKYPLPDDAQDKNKVTIVQKRPRLIDAKKPKRDSITDEDDTSDDEMIKENWTMGKINENIVCPICQKLFRTENVVFKHVKHCTGLSPNRSDSDKRSSERSSHSRDSDSKSRDSKSDDMDIEVEKSERSEIVTPKKRKSKESTKEKDDIILIEDSPAIGKLDHREPKEHESRKRTAQVKGQYNTNNLACDVCGKIFRQYSYLATHKLQHKREDTKKSENVIQEDKSVFSCEQCKKEFRKLHHLVQHRMIHNQSNVLPRPARKSSAEQSDSKVVKEQDVSKQSEDQSAAFRCEPCDKSFRKLHHLVEHRETHDGINRQKINVTVQSPIEKPAPAPPPQCDICKKTFRKLHHLIEHKEQHLETSSEKSDDKSIKSSLSTRDIIHECSLCYMVFPNEHSLNKHSIFCQRKKKQSAAKQVEETETADENIEISSSDETRREGVVPPAADNQVEKPIVHEENLDTPILEKVEEVAKIIQKRRSKEEENKTIEPKVLSGSEKDSIKSDVTNSKNTDNVSEIPTKVKKVEDKIKEERGTKINTPLKKTSHIKDKVAQTVNKRQKASNSPLQIVKESSAASVSSDEDDVRYMLNPDFKVENTGEGKLFMKVRAQKRNSLQIERPNSKDLVKRRTSLQHPPKIPRLKPKPVETKVISSNANQLVKNIPKAAKLETVPSTDSDDSDVKYSFPKTTAEKKSSEESKPKEIVKTPKGKRKSLIEKRKSLSGIAKRKSVGRPILPKHKAQEKTLPVQQIRKRIAEADHRCDCGQLFSSAALLARHTSLAHTPPRIRRRRSPPPEINTKSITKTTPNKSVNSTSKATDTRKSSTRTEAPKATESRKSSVRSDASKTTDTRKSNPKIEARKTIDSRKSSVRSDASFNPKPGRKSIADKSERKTPGRKPKVDKTVAESASKSVKTRRNTAHRGVPVPEKMRKLAEKKL